MGAIKGGFNTDTAAVEAFKNAGIIPPASAVSKSKFIRGVQQGVNAADPLGAYGFGAMTNQLEKAKQAPVTSPTYPVPTTQMLDILISS